MHFITFRSFVLASLLLTAALHSSALTLGRVRGGAWIGRPLQLSIPVQLDAGEDPAQVCVEAEVFHADTRIDGSRVRVRLQPIPGTQRQAMIELQSLVVVDEPVVTLYLKLGCQQRLTRRFVLLADPPPDAAGPAADAVGSAPASAMAAVPPVSPVAPVTPEPSSAAPSATPALSAQRMPRSKPVFDPLMTQSPATVARTVPVVRPVTARPPLARPRLRLDAVNLPAERSPQLKASALLLSQPDESATRRAEAAALWRSLSAGPHEQLRDAQQLRELQSEVKVLQGNTLKQQTALNEAKRQLEQAQQERYANEMVYLLAGALAAALAGIAWLWRRQGKRTRQSAWWQTDRPELEPEAAAAQHMVSGITPPAVETLATGAARDEQSPPGVPGSPQDPPVSIEEFSSTASRPFALQESEREVGVEELLDIQQQADFFVSLGQHEQAIVVLIEFIQEHPQTSPLAYLDLLNVYHQLGRRAEFAELQAHFSRIFNAEIPAFDAYTETSRGLEAYDGLLIQLQALWPSSQVLALIEDAMFRSADEGETPTFSLEAYRELLMLYGLAKEVAEPTPSTSSMSLPEIRLDLDLSQPFRSEVDAVNRGPEVPSQFDSRSRIDHSARPVPVPEPASSALLDFDLFDSATEAEIAPRHPAAGSGLKH